MKRLALALLLLTPAPTQASGPQCYNPCPHKHDPAPISCLDVVDCLPDLPAPRPCLDLDLWYFAGNRKCELVDGAYLKPAYLCVSECAHLAYTEAFPGGLCDTAERTVRKVRRHKLVNVLDAIVEAETLNRTLCEN